MIIQIIGCQKQRGDTGIEYHARDADRTRSTLKEIQISRESSVTGKIQAAGAFPQFHGEKLVATDFGLWGRPGVYFQKEKKEYCSTGGTTAELYAAVSFKLWVRALSP